jgi:hypothetical protein
MHRTWLAEGGIHKLTIHEIVFYYAGSLLYSKLARLALDAMAHSTRQSAEGLDH